jgi:hypothetical protein
MVDLVPEAVFLGSLTINQRSSLLPSPHHLACRLPNALVGFQTSTATLMESALSSPTICSLAPNLLLDLCSSYNSTERQTCREHIQSSLG